jgi:hypothetical protein
MNETLNTLISQNYDKYVEIATKILKKRKIYNDIHTRANQLVSTAYIYSTKFDSDDSSFLESVIVRHMTKQPVWKMPGTYKDEMSFAEPDQYDDSDNYISPIHSYDDDFDAKNEIQEEKLQKLKIKIESLDYLGRTIYDQVLAKGLSYPELTRITGIPRTSAYYLIRDLKNYLKDINDY